jgi:Uma2 family endonuclease
MSQTVPLPGVRRHRWTRREYEQLADVGVFGPEDRIELLDGEIWEMSPQGSHHEVAFELTAAALRCAFAGIGHVRHAGPFALDDVSEPEPDVAVVAGRIRDYAEAHPRQALLLVEVSQSSLAFDRDRKRPAYARNGVPEFWILDLTMRRLEVYRDPRGETYGRVEILQAGDTATPLHAPDATIRVDDLLP